MYKKFNQEKTIEAAAYLLSLNNGPMDRMKLIKLLYIADRESLRRWERVITNDYYFSMPNGQVLSRVLDLINGKIKSTLWSKFIRPIEDSPKVGLVSDSVIICKLTRGEIKLLNEIYSQYGNWDTIDLGDFTKTFSEYKQLPTDQRRLETSIEDILENFYDEENTKRIAKQLQDSEKFEMALDG